MMPVYIQTQINLSYTSVWLCIHVSTYVLVCSSTKHSSFLCFSPHKKKWWNSLKNISIMKDLHDVHLINKYLHSSMLSTWTNMSSILWTLRLFINTKIVYNFWHNSFLFSHLNRHNFHLPNVHFLDLYGFTLDTAVPESPGLPICIFL